MSISTPVRPKFGGKLKSDAYFKAVNSVIALLRPYSTLKTISEHLNSQHLTTPTGLPWTKQRVATYLRSNDINSTN
jgi:hypothetical protein